MKKIFALAIAFSLISASMASAAPTIGFIATQFSTESQARIATKLEENAKARGFNVQMLNSAGSFETQAAQLENLAQMKVDAIVLAMGHPIELMHALEKVFAASIPVITIDSGYAEGVVADITCDNFGIGARMSTYMADSLGGTGNVVVIKFEKHQGCRRRGKVLDVVLSEYPGINVLAEYSVVATKRFMDDTRAAVETYVTQYGEKIDAIWCAFDQLGYAAADVITQRLPGKKVMIVAADGNKETERRIAAGTFTATVAQPFEDMAVKAIDIVEKIVVEGKTPEQATGGHKIIYVDAPLLDAAALAEK